MYKTLLFYALLSIVAAGPGLLWYRLRTRSGMSDVRLAWLAFGLSLVLSAALVAAYRLFIAAPGCTDCQQGVAMAGFVFLAPVQLCYLAAAVTATALHAAKPGKNTKNR